MALWPLAPLALVLPLAVLFVVFVYLIITSRSSKSKSQANLPPGRLGWPFVGEILELLRANKDGNPWTFMQERVAKYGSKVFKTGLLGDPMAVFCGPSGNKFIYSNEAKLVVQWWPKNVQLLFGSGVINLGTDDAKRVRKMLMAFLGPDALVRYINRMDALTQHHIITHWEGRDEVTVYPAVKLYTFEMACRLFMSIEDSKHIKKLADLFNVLQKGVAEIPLNFPGTRFYSAMRATNAIKKELLLVAQHKKDALKRNTLSPSQDLMSHLLVTPDENGKFMTEMEIADNIITLLFAGHDTSSSAITMLIKYLAELPEVYENVLREQIGITSEKGPGELLDWEDIQKMRYSWNVISEVLRIYPPVSGGFREAIVDFDYAGYTIPKGWKVHWSAALTHRDSNLFPKEEEFDASRFEGAGPPPFSFVPFGGGPRMCLGKEFARIEMLVFLHNIVKRFKWESLIPNEKLEYDPLVAPVKGLPIRLRPHKSVI